MATCKEDKKFIIYMHKNKINGKIYIGQTCRSLRLRSGANGKNYATQPIFYRAIQKYGWDNFEHTVLYRDLTSEDANKKEIELIEKYNTRDRKCGYNQCVGGNNLCGDSNPFDGHSHTDTTKRIIAEKARERNIGENNPNYNNHKLKYGNNPNAKEVRQYDKDGNLISVYSCVSEAANELGVKSPGNISKNCRGTRGLAYGYIWVYTDELYLLDEKIRNSICVCDKVGGKNPMSKSVLQYSLDKELVNEWDSIADAARYLNKKYASEEIIDCAKGRRSDAYGYIWKYKE